ncbi:MAG: hypothetical protein O3A47_11150, partial [Chloroflexi bacterium]|nr:hypothetical protein [Chloroflexota bacterium]
MMKRLMILIIAVGLAGAVRADDEDLAGYRSRMRTWETERDKVVLSIVQSWLRGADGEALSEQIVRLTQLEVRLASDPAVELYLTQLTDAGDLDASVRDVARKYLQDRGLSVDTRHLFA